MKVCDWFGRDIDISDTSMGQNDRVGVGAANISSRSVQAQAGSVSVWILSWYLFPPEFPIFKTVNACPLKEPSEGL